MFDIGWSEMAVIMLVALVVIGPKDLPRLARTVGQWVAKGRAMAREFQRSLEDMAREAELDDVKREIEKVGRTNITKTIEKTVDPTGELGRAFDTSSSLRASPGGTPPAKAGAAPNGEAEPATPAAPKGEAQSKTEAKPKAEAKPKGAAKPKAAAKPRTSARSKSAAAGAPNAAAPETGKVETVAEPH